MWRLLAKALLKTALLSPGEEEEEERKIRTRFWSRLLVLQMLGSLPRLILDVFISTGSSSLSLSLDFSHGFSLDRELGGTVGEFMAGLMVVTGERFVVVKGFSARVKRRFSVGMGVDGRENNAGERNSWRWFVMVELGSVNGCWRRQWRWGKTVERFMVTKNIKSLFGITLVFKSSFKKNIKNYF